MLDVLFDNRISLPLYLLYLSPSLSTHCTPEKSVILTPSSPWICLIHTDAQHLVGVSSLGNENGQLEIHKITVDEHEQFYYNSLKLQLL